MYRPSSTVLSTKAPRIHDNDVLVPGTKYLLCTAANSLVKVPGKITRAGEYLYSVVVKLRYVYMAGIKTLNKNPGVLGLKALNLRDHLAQKRHRFMLS